MILVCACFHVFQARIGQLEMLRYKVSHITELHVTEADVSKAMLCVESPNPVTAALFCDFIWYVAMYAKSAGCSMIHGAGSISIVFDCLRRWSHDAEVVTASCWALRALAHEGSAAVKQAMCDVPDYEELLRAVELPFDTNAARVLRWLHGFV